MRHNLDITERKRKGKMRLENCAMECTCTAFSVHVSVPVPVSVFFHFRVFHLPAQVDLLGSKLCKKKTYVIVKLCSQIKLVGPRPYRSRDRFVGIQTILYQIGCKTAAVSMHDMYTDLPGLGLV